MADINLVDIFRREPRIGECRDAHFGQKRFEIEPFALAELPVGPTDDAAAH